MSWIDKLRRTEKQEPDKQYLYYVRQQLKQDVYAIVRVTWYDEDGIYSVTETRVNKRDAEVIQEFSDIVGNALTIGADVSVICVEKSERLDLHDL